jgi:TRAP transporter TAXI family solute receptor
MRTTRKKGGWKMKKIWAYLVIAMLLVSLAAAGCGGGTSTQKTTQLILATGGTAGTYYPLGGSMAQIFNAKIPGLNVTAQSTGASIENIRLVNKKEAELAIVQNDVMDYAYYGKESFAKDGKVTGFNAIAILYPEIVQVVARVDSGVETFKDFKGKRISVGAPGSGAEANSRQLFDAAGLKYEDAKVNFLSFAESADRFKDNQIDGFIFTAGIPNSAIQDISTQHKINFISLPDDMITELTKKYPFLTPIEIPANTYKGQDKAIKTVAVQATLIVNPNVKEDVVYNITKTLFENNGELAKAHAKGKEIKLENAANGITVPLHPGAVKYYKEKGLLK